MENLVGHETLLNEKTTKISHIPKYIRSGHILYPALFLKQTFEFLTRKTYLRQNT